MDMQDCDSWTLASQWSGRSGPEGWLPQCSGASGCDAQPSERKRLSARVPIQARLIGDMDDFFDPGVQSREPCELILMSWGLDFCTLGHHVDDGGIHGDAKGNTLGSMDGFS